MRVVYTYLNFILWYIVKPDRAANKRVDVDDVK